MFHKAKKEVTKKGFSLHPSEIFGTKKSLTSQKTCTTTPPSSESGSGTHSTSERQGHPPLFKTTSSSSTSGSSSSSTQHRGKTSSPSSERIESHRSRETKTTSQNTCKEDHRFEQLVLAPNCALATNFYSQTNPLVRQNASRFAVEYIFGRIPKSVNVDAHPSIGLNTNVNQNIVVKWHTLVFDLQAGGGAGANGTFAQICVPGGGGGAGHWKKRVPLCTLLSDEENLLTKTHPESVYLRVLVGSGGSSQHSRGNRDGGHTQVIFGPTNRLLCQVDGGNAGSRENGGLGGGRFEQREHCSYNSSVALLIDGCSAQPSLQSQLCNPGGCGGYTDISTGGRGGTIEKNATSGSNGSGGGGGAPNGSLNNAGNGGDGFVILSFHYSCVE